MTKRYLQCHSLGSFMLMLQCETEIIILYKRSEGGPQLHCLGFVLSEPSHKLTVVLQVDAA